MKKGLNVIISKNTKIGKDVVIGNNVIIYDNVIIGDNSFIGDNCILGERQAEYYKKIESYKNNNLIIGENSIIRSGSIIYENSNIGKNFQTGHRVCIREQSDIGNNCSVGTFSDLQGKLKIGDFVRIHSNVHIGQLSIIEDFVWIYPYVVLTNDLYPPMNDLKGVIVRKYAQITTGSIILPGVEIGENALIGASSLVRKNVKSERVVVGNPGRDICSVRDIKKKNGDPIYPWKDNLKDFRGYPWQNKKDFEFND